MVPDLQNKWVQRMIVMVDIRDLKHIHNPKSYLAAIGDCVDKLLASCNNNRITTLWAYKLLDSSMSPYRSRSKIEQNVGKWAAHVHFESTNHTQAFVSALKCLVNTNLANPSEHPQGFVHGNAEFIARSMQELIHDYVWEPLIFDNMLSGEQSFFRGKYGSSNLVVLFSELPRTRDGFKEFILDEKSCIPASMSDGDLLKNFSLRFGSVNEAFRSRDVHFCWIDIPPIVSAKEIMDCNEMSQKTVVGALKTMGWSFTSVDTLLLASKLVPFSLIWPTLAYPRVSQTQCGGYAEVNLEIEDIDGKALLCKTCEVQWIDLNPAEKLDSLEDVSCVVAGMDLSVLVQKHSAKISSRSSMRIHVGELFRKEKCPDVRNFVTDRVLLRGFWGKKKKGRRDHETNGVEVRDMEEEMDRDLIGDEMLERLQQENGEFKRGKPAWQLFLVFLSREKSLALVTVSDGKTRSFDAILEPLTVHTAVLNVLDSRAKLSVQITPTDIDLKEGRAVQVSTGAHETPENCETNIGYANEQSSLKQKSARSTLGCSASKKSNCSDSLTFRKSKECRSLQEGLHLHHNTWDSFYAAIVGGLCEVEPNPVPAVNLETQYTKGSCRQSKVLRFLNHWMRKSSKKLNSIQTLELQLNQVQSDTQLVEENKAASDIVAEGALQHLPECEQYFAVPVVSPSAVNAALLIEAADCGTAPVVSDHAKAFVGSLGEKIQHGLCSKEVDLKALAKRLMDVLIQMLQVQLEEERFLSSEIIEREEHSNELLISDQVMRLLLKKPKELATKYKGCLLPSSRPQCDDSTGSAEYTSEDKVREHELQILFRMEILASKLAGSLEEHVKDKLIKEICRLLENIQFNLPGGIFTGESLIEFADRVIASRYTNCLEQVVDKIYKRMEFYAIDDSEDILNSVSNHEKDSEIHGKEEDAEASSQNELMATISGEGNIQEQSRKPHFQVSCAEDQCPQNLCENHDMSRMHAEKHDIADDYEIKLKKAQAKRERAQRFAHFASRAPDLQRVWTPKQPTQIKKKQSKTHVNLFRKKRRKDAEDDVVYETPIQTTKMRKHVKDGKAGLAIEKQAKVTIDVVHETPFPITKVQNRVQEAKAMTVDHPTSRTSTEPVTSSMNLDSVCIPRALFGERKLLQGSVFTGS